MHARELFETISKHDHLGILNSKSPEKLIADFLAFSKDDVAKATRVPKASVRYDQKITQELKERLLEIGNIYNLVAGYFKGDLKKTVLWFKIKNPALGNISPRDMIRFGRYQKLLKFIQNALLGNSP